VVIVVVEPVPSRNEEMYGGERGRERERERMWQLLYQMSLNIPNIPNVPNISNVLPPPPFLNVAESAQRPVNVPDVQSCPVL
jgi:hypothetical protein